MLVDDHAVVRAGYRLLLSQSGLIEIVREAERGEEACQQYAECKPDLVVMDLSMPGMGGLAAIRRILARDPDARILAFSIHDEAVYAERALDAGLAATSRKVAHRKSWWKLSWPLPTTKTISKLRLPSG